MRIKEKKEHHPHEKLEMQSKPGYCHICGKLNKNERGLNNHYKLRHPLIIKEISDEGVVIYEQPSKG